MAIDFRELAARLSCREFAEAEGMRIRHNRIACPLHGGHDYNMALNDDGSAYCYVCHKAADVVQLASALWRMNQRDAAVELNQRFRLGLQAETVNAAELDRRRREREAARQAEAEAKRSEALEWGKACDAERAARTAIERFTEADVDTPAFDLALRRLCDAQQRCDMLSARVEVGNP